MLELYSIDGFNEVSESNRNHGYHSRKMVRCSEIIISREQLKKYEYEAKPYLLWGKIHDADVVVTQVDEVFSPTVNEFKKKQA